MPRWIRVFGTNDHVPRASDVMGYVLRCGLTIESEVLGEDAAWEQLLLRHEFDSEPVMLERLSPDDPELADEVEPLLDWLGGAAAPDPDMALRRILQRARQIYIVGVPDSAQIGTPGGQLTILLARFLCRFTEGTYQVDHEGFYDPQGKLLVRDR
jgi:hypothetical protein